MGLLCNATCLSLHPTLDFASSQCSCLAAPFISSLHGSGTVAVLGQHHPELQLTLHSRWGPRKGKSQRRFMCQFCLAPELSHQWKWMRELPTAVGEYKVLVCKRSKTQQFTLLSFLHPSTSCLLWQCHVWEGWNKANAWCACLHINSRSVCWLALRQNRAELVLEVGSSTRAETREPAVAVVCCASFLLWQAPDICLNAPASYSTLGTVTLSSCMSFCSQYLIWITLPVEKRLQHPAKQIPAASA